MDKKMDDLDRCIIERDHWEKKSTELANDVAKTLDFNIGEHTSANCPVQNAIDELSAFSPTNK